MKWLAAPFIWVARQLQSFSRTTTTYVSRKLERKYRFEEVDELPDHPRPHKVYVAGAGANAWVAAMICPCGCKEVIELNLLPQARPRWRATHNSDGTATLSPSVWRQKNCRSHFILRDGRIRWC